MAASTPTRRGLLGAIAILPAAILTPHPATATSAMYSGMMDGGRWWRLFARMERLDAEADRLGKLADTTGIGEYDDRSWRCVELAGEVRKRLSQTPAPDLKAALWKYDHITGLLDNELEDEGSLPTWAASYILPAVLDVRRFLTTEGR